MTDRSLKVGAFLLLIGFSILISFGFFCVSISYSDTNYKSIEHTVHLLVSKVDSLEQVVNISFKEKRDTTIIQVHPQEIKIYYNKEK